jgi:hypothetical protein
MFCRDRAVDRLVRIQENSVAEGNVGGVLRREGDGRIAPRSVGGERHVIADAPIIDLDRRTVRHRLSRDDVRDAHPFALKVHVARQQLDGVRDHKVARFNEDFAAGWREGVDCVLDVGEIRDFAVRRTEVGSDHVSGREFVGGTGHCRRS